MTDKDDKTPPLRPAERVRAYANKLMTIDSIVAECRRRGVQGVRGSTEDCLITNLFKLEFGRDFQIRNRTDRVLSLWFNITTNPSVPHYAVVSIPPCWGRVVELFDDGKYPDLVSGGGQRWQKRAKKVDDRFQRMMESRGLGKSDDENLYFVTLALCGEAGELANLMKKRWRGDKVDSQQIAGELADIQIYLQQLFRRFGLDADQECCRKLDELEARLDTWEAQS